MSTGMSIFVIALVVINMGVIFLLFLWAPHCRIPMKEDGTTGHVWANGAVRESLHRTPTWWLLISTSMFIAAFAHLYMYPGLGNYAGSLHWTSQGKWHRDRAANQAKLGQLEKRFDLYTIEELSRDSRAVQIGRVLFGDNCAACHGMHGKGNILVGAPNLTDSTWLYGGTGKDIQTSIHDGRTGVMPAWKSLGEDKVNNLVQYVLSLSGRKHDAAMAKKAEPIFKSTCAACHGKDGTGNQAIGAPNLTDKIWKWGSSVADIHKTIHDGRQGHMPTWSKRLSNNQIHLLAAYVYHISHHDNDKAK